MSPEFPPEFPIQYLTSTAQGRPLDLAIHIAQKLVDRIIFIAFCEDRELLPARCLFRAWKEIPLFYRVANPKWQNFLALFRNIDEGSLLGDVPAYSGGLFRKDDAVDSLQLDDTWTDLFKNIGDYDFESEVSADALGEIFERSVTDVVRIRVAGGLWESQEAEDILPKMEKSPEHTVQEVAGEKLAAVEAKHGVDLKSPEMHTRDGKLKRCVEEAVAALRTIRVVDPACGGGAFLVQAYDVLEEHYFDLAQALDHVDPVGAEAIREQLQDFILRDNLFGNDSLPEAVEITQLSLWLRSAQRGRPLVDLSRNIVCANSRATVQEIGLRATSRGNMLPRVFVGEELGSDWLSMSGHEFVE